MNYGSMAGTGATVTLFGVAFDQFQLIAISAGLVILGALAVRYGFRRGKSAQEV